MAEKGGKWDHEGPPPPTTMSATITMSPTTTLLGVLMYAADASISVLQIMKWARQLPSVSRSNCMGIA